MLKIFKNYTAKTSLLDDFNFYETREKSNQGKKSSKPATLQMEIFKDDGFTVSSFFSIQCIKLCISLPINQNAVYCLL